VELSGEGLGLRYGATSGSTGLACSFVLQACAGLRWRRSESGSCRRSKCP